MEILFLRPIFHEKIRRNFAIINISLSPTQQGKVQEEERIALVEFCLIAVLRNTFPKNADLYPKKVGPQSELI